MSRLTIKNTCDESYVGLIDTGKNPGATLKSVYHDICNKLGKYEDVCEDPDKLKNFLETLHSRLYHERTIGSIATIELIESDLEEFGL